MYDYLIAICRVRFVITEMTNVFLNDSDDFLKLNDSMCLLYSSLYHVRTTSVGGGGYFRIFLFSSCNPNLSAVKYVFSNLHLHSYPSGSINTFLRNSTNKSHAPDKSIRQKEQSDRDRVTLLFEETWIRNDTANIAAFFAHRLTCFQPQQAVFNFHQYSRSRK